MKYLDAYRDARTPGADFERDAVSAGRSVSVLEVCGGQAQNLLRFGIARDLPDGLELVHGPSCPVCATPKESVDRALSIARRPGIILAASGDLMRASGSLGHETLLDAKDAGADIRVVYSPIDALALARKNPDREVVVFAAGFETTAPAAAAALIEADRLRLDNFLMLGAFFRISAAVAALLADAGNRAAAVLVPGLVCAVTGVRDYEPIAERFRVPIVVTGPGPSDLLDAVARAVRQIDRGTFAVENQYARAVRPDGNPQARAAIDAVFESADAEWRGLGLIRESGLILRERFRRFDASSRFACPSAPMTSTPCPASGIQTGRVKPFECLGFGTSCAPDHPLGPFMASAEGVCAAYHRYRRPSQNGQPASSALSAVAASGTAST